MNSSCMGHFNYHGSAPRQVQLLISFVNFRATSLVHFLYIFSPTVVLRTLFLKHMLRAHYISTSLATVIWECSLNQFCTSLFASLSVHQEPRPVYLCKQQKSLVSKSLRYSLPSSLSAARDISSKSGKRWMYCRLCVIYLKYLERACYVHSRLQQWQIVAISLITF